MLIHSPPRLTDDGASLRRLARRGALSRVFAFTVLTGLLPLAGLAEESYRLHTVTDQLRWPWSVAQLPGGDFLVSEREGALKRVTPSGEVTPVDGGPATLFAGQGGYLDLVLHPLFAENRWVFLSYATGTLKENYTAVYRARLEGASLRNGREIFRINTPRNAPQHYGGRMLFLQDASLLLTSGEGFELREQAQDRASHLGKTLRITGDGEPAGLPEPGSGERTALWTRGHRNPQGLTAVGAGREIYLHEHGPRGGDELNLIEGGANYGWPAVTHGIDYSGAYVSPYKTAPQMRDPLWVWTPSIAPSGLAWYDGRAFPTWRRSLFLGALVDREVRRLQMHEGRVVREEALFGELNARIRDVRVFGEGLFLLTDGEQGALIEVRPRR